MFNSKADDRTSYLIKALRAGDENAFAEIYASYGGMVRGRILQMVRDPELTEDLTQETFLRLWTSAAILDESAPSLGPWLVTVARRLVFDHLRSAQSRNQKNTVSDALDQATNGAVVEHDYLSAERARLLRSSLGNLDSQQLKVLELAYFEGFSQTEIAETLNRPLGTVKSWVRLGLKNLRSGLEKQNPGLNWMSDRSDLYSRSRRRVVCA